MPMRSRSLPAAVSIVALAIGVAEGGRAAETDTAALGEAVVVTGRRFELAEEARSANQGVVQTGQIEALPALRPAEILESVPGLVVTQHSGDGKANQYYLRGFNLDHGTDFALRVDGVPVNLPTNAHGQGYADANFLIPELVDRVEYRKGTYYAEEGDFSAAGSADVQYRRRLEASFLQLATGGDGYRRAVVAASPEIGGGDLLLGGEVFHNDGPWQVLEGYRKLSGLAKYTRGDASQGFSAELSAADSHWTSTDQIPLRAVTEGLLSRYGSLNPTDGGATHRYAGTVAAFGPWGAGTWRAQAYAFQSALDLYSDFTYATDPVHGDQFEQTERRTTEGMSVSAMLPTPIAGADGQLRFGLQARNDVLDPVALYRTEARVRYAAVRVDTVHESSVGAYASEALRLSPWARVDAGARVDRYAFHVDSSLAANSGSTSRSIVSPKLALTFGPWHDSELFLDWGRGFHSNDARGTTIRVDPNDGVTPVSPVTPLVRAEGMEVGWRTQPVSSLAVTLALWTLRLDSELVFSGDGGTTEPSRPSRRTGVELGFLYTPTPGWAVDADAAYTRAHYTSFDPVGDAIPNALRTVVSVGATYHEPTSRWSGGLRLRYFGRAPLIEDDSAQSPSTLTINADVAYRPAPQWQVRAEIYTLLNRRDNDITYFYASQLPGEATSVNDLHFHPVEPRAVRLAVTRQF